MIPPPPTSTLFPYTTLFRSNQSLWSQLTLTPPEEFNYTSFDGKKIQAWIQKPPDFDPHKKYPLILDIHGGPHAAYGWVFDHRSEEHTSELQSLTNLVCRLLL